MLKKDLLTKFCFHFKNKFKIKDIKKAQICIRAFVFCDLDWSTTYVSAYNVKI